MTSETSGGVHPLKIANLTFPNNVIQGPLAGISSAPFRLQTWKYGQPAFTCTEMIAAKALMQGSLERQRSYISKLPTEGPVSFQLVGNDPKAMAVATKMVTDFGADIIDLNCGCSVKKVRRKDEGSRLLANPPLLYKLITTIRNNTHLPVSFKIRVDAKTSDNFNGEIVKIANESGVDFIAVHGRNWRERYNTPCHYDEIKYFVEEVKVPVIGNGDIADLASLKKMFETGCAGAMIGRAGIGHPWLIKKLITEMRGETFIEPTKAEIGRIFLEQVELLADFFRSEKSAVLQARLLIHRYTKGLSFRKDICEEANKCLTLEALREICGRYFV